MGKGTATTAERGASATGIDANIAAAAAKKRKRVGGGDASSTDAKGGPRLTEGDFVLAYHGPLLYEAKVCDQSIHSLFILTG
jgi:hypothetical protein